MAHHASMVCFAGCFLMGMNMVAIGITDSRRWTAEYGDKGATVRGISAFLGTILAGYSGNALYTYWN